MFDRERLREVFRKLSEDGRQALALFLESKVLPEVKKKTAEWRAYLNRQIDSEDCVRGLIQFAQDH